MRISATPEVIELVRSAGDRLYVWPAPTRGCQPMVFLQVGDQRPAGHAFRRAPFAGFELYLDTDGPWPQELALEACRGRVRALWDGAAWRI